MARPRPTVAGESLDTGSAHEHLDRVVAHHDALAQRQLSMYPPGAIGASGGGVGGADLLGQPGMTERSRRWCSPPPCVVARHRHVHDPAAHLNRESFRGHRRDDRVPAFWGHRLLQQLGRSAMDRQFGLQLGDAPPGGHKLNLVGGPDTRHLARIDELLTAPVVNRLIADLKITNQLRHRTASLQQIEHLAAELRRIASRHISPQRVRRHASQPTRLHRTRGTSQCASNPGWFRPLTRQERRYCGSRPVRGCRGLRSKVH
jgi:hypothetical protein